MKRAIIFLNGDRSDLTAIKNYIDKSTLLVGCDGGTHHIFKLGLKPNVVIGDFDSFPAPHGLAADIQEQAHDGTIYVRYPTDKDFTDGELAIQYAAQAGCQEIILAGTLGTRIDHLLGNVLLLQKQKFAKLNIKIIEGNQEIYLARKRVTVNGTKGDTISFIPVSADVSNMQSTGLKYDLANYTLSLQGNRGISNVMTGRTAEVIFNSGELLVVHTKQ